MRAKPKQKTIQGKQMFSRTQRIFALLRRLYPHDEAGQIKYIKAALSAMEGACEEHGPPDFGCLLKDVESELKALAAGKLLKACAGKKRRTKQPSRP